MAAGTPSGRFAVEAEGLGYAYAGGRKGLCDVTLRLREGDILGLAGANGAGKSTLLALLGGILQPGAGSLLVAGLDAARESAGVRRASAMVFQEADLAIIGSTVEEDLLLGLDASRREEALALAARLGLAAPDVPVQTLSFGQKRKLCLAAALLRKPRLLLLDEPFAGLDYPGAREMRALLASGRAAGLTQVVAVHDLEPLADLADCWLVLADGRQAAFGTAEEVFPRLRGLGVRPPCAWQAGLGVRPWDAQQDAGEGPKGGEAPKVGKG
ncbi:ABC transporter related protein [Desulfovibrio sp. X2]|uniref:energy-coupling factor ABC transporter ATP-binding protein n=1 Tax=Desulfovibrio sp. X2 TaxID=941449 RepID=UPI000358B198|nr:ABC transporter ATP-binding protein [Desulfovibrio sp. X2]EPR37436.1 ABC transporter related protein [Desulfovibrio sp. X2]